MSHNPSRNQGDVNGSAAEIMEQDRAVQALAALLLALALFQEVTAAYAREETHEEVPHVCL